MKRVALYVRVSTQEQKKGLSIDNQLQALKKYAEQEGYKVAGIYNDAGISARKKYTRRPALLQLLSDCESGKVDLILFTRLDRWFRSVGYYYEVQNQLDRYGVPWRAIWEDYNVEDSAGVFKLNILLSVAQSEADRTSDRLKSTFAYKRERGDWLGSAPTGYRIAGRDLVKDEETCAGMQAFFDTYFNTLSITKALRSANENGLPLLKSSIYKIIKNPVYCGESNCGYKNEPYITREQYDFMLARLSGYTRTSKYPKLKYKYGGIVYCGYCGARMISKTVCRTHTNGDVIYYKKYLCNNRYNMKVNCPALQITESRLDDYLMKYLSLLIDERIEEVKMLNNSADIKSATKQRKALENKLARLADLYAEGDITMDAYKAKRDTIREQISSIIIEPVKAPEPMPENWRDVYAELDEEHQMVFMHRIIKKITVTNETKDHPDIEFL